MRTLSKYGRWALGFFLLLSCSGVHHPMIRTELVFGLHDSTQNRDITLKEWQNFVDTEIAVRLPSGFTILEGCRGTWFSETSGFQSEDCRILLVIHPQKHATQQKILEIAKTYKERFHQEAVLHLSSPIYQEIF